MNINFNYIDNCGCNLNGEIYGKYTVGQCCCKCSYREKVVAHCLHVAHEPKMSCNCGDEMGFYVCTVFDDMEPRSGTASICGAHGLCECFSKRK